MSAVLSQKSVSVTGLTTELQSFERWLGSRVTVKHGIVNAWYHGGDQLESVAEEVIEDSKRRQINFPSSDSLLCPLRSPFNGSLANEEISSENDLARWIVRHMLIHPFDWLKTSESIIAMLEHVTSRDDRVTPSILSFGPSSGWLLGPFKSHRSQAKLKTLDLSAFQKDQPHDSQDEHQGDIAIVGMGVHYPESHGIGEMWNTINSGNVAVSEVRQNSRPSSKCMLSHDVH